MRIYTRTGDGGETGLVGGGRVRKDDPRMDAVGSLDELNASVGITLQQPLSEVVRERLLRVQRRLFELGAELATPADSVYVQPGIPVSAVSELEAEMDALDADLPELRNFILPGGTRGSAHLHWCRTVCRRAERAVVTLSRETEVRTETVSFINRLSDWFFVAARHENHQAGVADVPWIREETTE